MAYLFDGVDDVITRDNADISLDPTVDQTVTFWAYAESEGEGGEGRFFIIRDSADTVFFLMFFTTGTNKPRIILRAGNAGTDASGVDNDVTLNVWQHWAMRFRASDDLFELIRDGTDIVASISNDPGTTSVGNQLIVGANSTGGESAFDGRIADVRWWEGVRLSLGEIRSVMRGRIVQPSSASLWWSLFNNATDYSGNGRSGSISGPVVADHAPVGPPFGLDLGWQGAFTVPAAGFTPRSYPRGANRGLMRGVA